MTDIRREISLRSCFRDGSLDVMNFLNEATSRFPSAISFGPGRPLDSRLEVEAHGDAIARFVRETATRTNQSHEQVWIELGQYGCGCTNGILSDVIATHLRRDEGIHVDAGAVMVTVGAQEAMAIVIAGLFEPERDILLVSDPTYIGVTGIARILGVRVRPVVSGDAGLEPEAVEQAIVTASQHGRVRALYDIPDFNNPLGTSLSIEARRRLLEICDRHDVLVIEDNPYGMYAYDHERRPTLKSLDVNATVLYIGSFAKTLYPGLRVGYLVADQLVASDGRLLAQELSKVKSLTTVNTPPLMQAVVGGILARRHIGADCRAQA